MLDMGKGGGKGSRRPSLRKVYQQHSEENTDYCDRRRSLLRKRCMLFHFASRYGIHGGRGWWKDEKFLKDLQEDEVNSEILAEELRSLQDEEPRTCRQKLVKVLESNPMLVFLCVLVLLDAAIVMAEILTDHHAVKAQYNQASDDLKKLVVYLKRKHELQLKDFEGHNIDELLHILHRNNTSKSDTQHQYEKDKRHISYSTFEETRHLLGANLPAIEESFQWGQISRHRQRHLLDVNAKSKSIENYHKLPKAGTEDIEQYQVANSDISIEIPHRSHSGRYKRTQYSSSNEHAGLDDVRLDGRSQRSSNEITRGYIQIPDVHVTTQAAKRVPRKFKSYRRNYDTLHHVAHYLHYCSISILALFVVQVLLKVFGMGVTFFRRKMEVVDGGIIVSSFILDLILLMRADRLGEGGAAVNIAFLVWRIIRVVNSVMVTAKRRQEFRIKLLKRARKKAENRIQVLEEEIDFHHKEIESLKQLCHKSGVHRTHITACTPRRFTAPQKMNTKDGLSSIASLSLTLGMSLQPRIPIIPPLSLPLIAGKKGKNKDSSLRLEQTNCLRVPIVREPCAFSQNTPLRVSMKDDIKEQKGARLVVARCSGGNSNRITVRHKSHSDSSVHKADIESIDTNSNILAASTDALSDRGSAQCQDMKENSKSTSEIVHSYSNPVLQHEEKQRPEDDTCSRSVTQSQTHTPEQSPEDNDPKK